MVRLVRDDMVENPAEGEFLPRPPAGALRIIQRLDCLSCPGADLVVLFQIPVEGPVWGRGPAAGILVGRIGEQRVFLGLRAYSAGGDLFDPVRSGRRTGRFP